MNESKTVVTYMSNYFFHSLTEIMFFYRNWLAGSLRERDVLVGELLPEYGKVV